MSPNQSEKGNPLIKNRYKQGSLAKLPGKPPKGKRQLTDEERQARIGQRKALRLVAAGIDRSTLRSMRKSVFLRKKPW